MILQRVYEKMEEDFKRSLPDSLYLNYQELSNRLGSTPEAWETLLDQTEFKRYIDQKLAKYMEIDARKALNQLANSKELASSDITALNRLIENSKLLQQKHQKREHVVLTYLPARQTQEENINE